MLKIVQNIQLGFALLWIAATNVIASNNSAEVVLTHLSQLRSYVESKTVAVRSVALEGVVTWVAAGGESFVLQSGTNAMRFELESPGVSVRSGQRVRLEGSVALGGGRAVLRQWLQLEDDGLHGMRERSARQRFEAGWHPFKLDYFQGFRDMGLEVYYQPPGSSRQQIPPELLFHSEDGTNFLPGVRVDYYEGVWAQLPDFHRLNPVRSVIATNLALIEPNAGTNFALRFSGFLRLASAGEHRFYLASDDGSRLSFDQRPWNITVLGEGTLPAAQILLPGQRLDQADLWRWAELSGEVRFAGASDGVGAFELASDAGRIQVELASAEDWCPELLLGAQVRVRGVIAGQGKPGGPLLAGELFAASASEVVIEQLPAQMWRRFPTDSLATLRSTLRGGELVKVSGTAREVKPGVSAVIEDATGRMLVHAGAAAADWNGANLQTLGVLRGSGAEMFLHTVAVALMTSNGMPRVGITPIGDIRSMSVEELERGHRLKIRGVVTTDWSTFAVAVHDGDYGISCWADAPFSLLQMGDYVEVEGTTRAGAFGPNLGNIQVRKLGRAALPHPLTPGWGRLINGSLDHQWVEVQGVVQRIEGRNLTLEMVGGRIGIELVRGEAAELARLLNAVVRVRGSVAPIYNTQRQIEGVKLRVSSPLYIQIEESAKEDPFAEPEKTFEELTRFDPGGANPFYRVKVRGQIVHASGLEGHLMDGVRGLRILLKAEMKLKPGDHVEVVGFPEVGGLVPVLREALVRVNGQGELADPKHATVDELFSGRLESTRVQLDALLAGSAQSQQERTLDLKFEGRFVTARLRGAQAAALDAPVGSAVRVTGTCVARGAREPGVIEACDLLVNYAMDVSVLRRPPWWTPGRILVLTGILASVLLAAMAWIYLLHRKVEQRTAALDREMRQRKEAELQRASEQERSRIARDLHDDLGSSLTEISLLAGLGLTHATAEAANERFEEIAGKSRSLVNNLDAIVWAADPEEDTMESCADYLAGHARVFLESSGIACRFKVPIDFPPVKLGGRVRHDLFLAVKESLNNVVRHAQATEVEFALHLNGSRLELLLADNGRGFNPQDVTRGNGLANLRERLAGIGGGCVVESSPGKGTRVRLSLDLKTTPP
jgi:signal transduction histidine kinase